MSSGFESFYMIAVVDQLNSYDSVASELMSTQLIHIISMQSIITHDDSSDEFQYISAINSKLQDIITLEELISRLCTGLKKAAHTLKYTTHHYIRTTGLITKSFFTDKAHLHYKQLSCQYSTLYTDFLK